MSTNNRGSILLFSMIIFTVISVMTITIININRSVDEVMNFEYKEFNLEEQALNGIELAISQVASQIDNKLLVLKSEEEFDSYFSSQEFIESINYEGENVEVKLTKVEGENIQYRINSKYVNEGSTKRIYSNIKINNPFTTTGSTIYSKDLLEVNNYTKI